MNYHNGRLRNTQDSTLRLLLDTQKHDLPFGECAPFAALLMVIILLVGLLMYELFGFGLS